MAYQAKEYPDLKNIGGLSAELLDAHFLLYQGYVKNCNLILEESESTTRDSIQFAELKRRLGWEFNGMRLHELYFENLTATPAGIETCPDIYNKIQLDFGSTESFIEEFKAMGVMRGIGWVVLYHDKWADRLMNFWIDEHDSGHPSGCRPLIVMDLFEHAFLPDKLRRPDYVNIFMEHLNWSSAEERMKAVA